MSGNSRLRPRCSGRHGVRAGFERAAFKTGVERLTRRIEKIRREAGERLNKDAVVQCRVEARQMDQLQEIASAKGLSVSALTRMWLIERLQQEKSA